MIPLLEGCRLSPNIFDVRYHAFYNNFNVQDEIYNRVKRSLDETGFASITSHYMLLNTKFLYF